MNTKRIISVLVSCLFFISSAFAEITEGTCGAHVTFMYDDDTDILTIMGDGDMDNFVAPDVVPWSKLVNNIKKVEIKEGVTSIGDYAFYGCDLLWKVTIPQSVTRIGSYAFGACLYLFEINLPETVTEIGNYAFRGCTYFSDFTFPDSLTKLGTGVLYGCNSLTKVNWKSTAVKQVPDYTFAYCSVLENVNLPKDITKLGSNSFSYSGLKRFSMPDSLTNIGSYAFSYCYDLDSITLPPVLKDLGSCAFLYCKSLSSIDIPASVKTINNYVFEYCTSLEDVTMHVGLNTIGYQAFIYCSKLKSVVIPRSVTSMSSYVFYNCSSLESVVLPDGLNYVPEFTFRGCTALKRVTFPNTFTSVDQYAFWGCPNLRKIEFPSSLCQLAAYSFSGTTNLDTVIINRVKEPLLNAASTTFGATDTFVVVVPCSREADYRQAKVWSNYADSMVTIPVKGSVVVSANNDKWGSVSQSGIYCGVDANNDTLTATPASGYLFAKWTDGVTCNPRIVDVQSDTAFSAVFVKLKDKGQCGDSLSWKLTDDGVLDINGNGAMYDYVSGSAPWSANAASIKSIEIDTAVTAIGANAFSGLTALKSISLPSSKMVTADKTALKGLGTTTVVYVPCALMADYSASSTWGALTVKALGESFTINLAVNDSALGSVSITGAGCLDSLDVYVDTLLAVANTGSAFSHWADDETNTIAKRAVVVKGNTTYTAVFSKVIEEGQCGDDLWWTFDTEGTLIIKGNGTMYNFNSVSDVPWKDYIEQIKTVSVAEGATTIGNYAFFGCKNMLSVGLPTTLTSVGNYSFYSCMNLEELTIPEKVTSLGSYAFSGCTTIRSVVLPVSVKSMGSCVFMGCTLLEKCDIKASITGINSYTFAHCNALTDVNIPETVTSIGSWAFYRCYKLKDVKLPAKLTTIYYYAFDECRSIEHIDIPEKVSYIGYYAFAYCTSLKEFDFPDYVQTVQDAVFYNCISLTRVSIPAVVTTIKSSAFSGCTVLKEVNLPTALTTIEGSAFRYCNALTSVKLSPNIISLGGYAYANCSGLRHIELNKSLTSIGGWAFSNDTLLTKVVIPASVLTLGDRMFDGSKNLDTVQLKRAEDALTTIENNGLYNVSKNLKVYVPCNRVDDYKVYSYWASYPTRIVSDLELYTVTLASNQDTLGTVSHSGLYCADGGVGDSITATPIGSSDFLYWSDGVKDNPRVVTITSDTTFKAIFLGIISRGKCGDKLYWQLDSRGILSITGEGKMYDYNAGTAPWSSFAKYVQTLTTSDQTTSIGDYAFYGCDQLASVDLAASVTSIGKNAFTGCSALSELKCNSTAAMVSLGDEALKNTASALAIYVPCGLETTYQKSDDWKNNSAQIETFGTLYNIEVASNADSLGTATIRDVVCDGNQLEAKLEANAHGYNHHFSFWSDDEDNEDTLRTITFSTDTTVTAVFATVVDSGQCGKTLYWKYDSQHKLYIYGKGDMYNYSAGNPAGWTKYVEEIKRVQIADSATSIGNYAFYACTALRKISIPQTVKSVCHYAFYGCTSLNNVVLPDSLVTLGYYSFYGCSSLEKIEVPRKVKLLDTYTFALCTSLKKAVINSSVATNMREFIFSGCSLLDTVIINSPLTTIERYAFNGCRSLRSVSLPSTLTAMGDHVFSTCVALKHIDLPYGLTAIPYACFYNCQVLDSVVIPATVGTLGEYAFQNCRSLTTFTLPYNIRSIGRYCFSNCVSLVNVKIPSGISNIEDYTFEGCNKLRSVFIPNTVTSIGYCAFNCNYALSKVAIPSSVITLGTYSFNACRSLDTFIVRRYQDPLTVLNSAALNGTSKNMNIYIPCSRYDDYLQAESWKNYWSRMYLESFLYRIALYPNYKSRGSAQVIGTGCSDSVSVDTIKAFTRGCGQFSHWSDGNTDNPRIIRVTSDSLLEAIFVADTVKYGKLGNLNWTLYCDSLLIIEGEGEMPDFEKSSDAPWNKYADQILYVDVLKGITSIGRNAFNGDSLLLGISLPSTITRIGDSALANCVAMDTLTIPSSCTTIGDKALAGSHLSFIYMPETVQHLGSGVFANCSNLKSAVFYKTFTHLSDSLFAGCTALDHFNMPSAMTKIDDYAFAGCTALTTLNFPDSLKEIGEGAFAGCTGLTTVTLTDAIMNIGDKAFANCTAIDTVECLRFESAIPVIGVQVFDDEADGRTIFVDCNSLLDYRKAANWSDYRTSLNTYGQMYDINLLVSADTAGTAELTYTLCDEKGTRDSILATPIGCHRFLRWSDGNTDNPRLIVLNRDTTLTAIFRIGYIDAGQCGDNIEWELSCDSILKITGTGAIPSYSESNPSPWADYAAAIKELTIANGVTSIGNNAFADIEQITDVYLPASVTVLGSNAFAGCSSLDSVRADAATMVTADSSTFTDAASNLAIYVPCVLLGDYNSNHGWEAYQKVINPIKVPFVVNGVVANDTLGSIAGDALTCIDTVSTIHIIAVPDEGAVFVRWDDGSTTAERDVKVMGDTAFTAYFTPDTFVVKATGLNSLGTVKGGGKYAYGHVATLIPQPKEGYHFVRWSTGSAASKLDTLVKGNISITAEFAIDTCKLTVLASGDGKAFNSGTFLWGTKVEVHAVADTLHHLVMWDNGVRDTLYRFILKSDSTITALFAIDSFAVTADVIAGKGSVDGTGMYPYGAKVTLTPAADRGYHFLEWEGGDKRTSIDTVVNYAIEVLPIFEIDTYTLDVLTDGPGKVETNGTRFQFNTTAVMEETVTQKGYHFVKWSTGHTTQVDTVLMTSDSTVTAYFAIDTFSVSAITEHGTVEGAGRYTYGDSVTLVAIPEIGYHFDGWKQGESDSIVGFRVYKDSSITALFAIDSFKVSISAVNGTVAGAGTYAYGQVANVKVTPDEHYHLIGWSNGSHVAAFDTTVHSAITLEATCAIDSFKVTIANSEYVKGDTAGLYAYGDSLHLTATPETGYHFMKWSNGSTSISIAIGVKCDTTLIPTFAIDTFTIGAVAENGKVSGAGRYTYGSEATLIATPETGYHFIKWSTGYTADTLSFAVKHNDTLIATIAIDTFDVTISDASHVSGSRSGRYTYGETVKVKANPETGYHFVKWSTGSTDKEISVRIVSDTTLTPTFAIDSFKVSAIAKNGKVTGTGNYAYGSSVELTAVPNRGYRFENWEGGSTDKAVTFKAYKDTTVTAYFAPDSFNVYVTEGEYVTGVKTGRYVSGDTLNISAVEREGYDFTGWSNGSTEKNIQLVVMSDTTLEPYFEHQSFYVEVVDDDLIEGDPSGNYYYGDVVNFIAPDKLGYHFVKWNTGATTTDLTIRVKKDLTIEAYYAIDTFTVEAVAENGRVEGLGRYTYGETAHLVAIANVGYSFKQWSNGDKDSVRTEVIKRNFKLYPIFEENPDDYVSVYDATGRCYRVNVLRTEALIGLPKGMYIIKRSGHSRRTVKHGEWGDNF